MEICSIKDLSDPHVHLMSLDIRECPVNRFLHRVINTTSYSQPTRARRTSHFKPIQPNLSLVIYGGRIHRARSKRIGGDQIPSTLFWHAYVTFFPGLAVDVGERGLIVLK